MFYRLSAADFTTLEGAWDNTALQCDKNESGTSLNKQDGRAYQLSIRNKKLDLTSASLIEYLDFPKCTLSTNDWVCQMYLPKREKQTDGYPRFDVPGVVQGYYIAPYIPGVKELALSKASQVMQGATHVTTYAAVFVAAVASLLF